MQNIQSQSRRPNFVRAMFDDGVATFELPGVATLAELAGRLRHLGKRHKGRAIALTVKLDSQSN